MPTRVRRGMLDEAAQTADLTAKGDLIGHDGSAELRVPVGAVDTVLTADPTAAAGIAWKAPASIGNIVGEVRMLAMFAAPAKWLAAQGQAISRTTYAALFAAITLQKACDTTNGSAVLTMASTAELFPGCPVEGAGIPVGARVLTVDSGTQVTLTAQATVTAAGVSLRFLPWGAGDGAATFTLPDLRGRSAVGAGTGAIAFDVTAVNPATDELTVPAQATLETGAAVVYTSSGTVAAPLVSGTTYYVIRVSATVVKLATSRALALLGTAINLTGAGTGTQRLTVNLTARSTGQYLGEETHALTVAEIPSHTHADGVNPSGTTGTDPFGIGAAATTGATGGSGAHNNLPPGAVLLPCIYAGV